MNISDCKPALIYGLIATIMILVGFIIVVMKKELNGNNISLTSSHCCAMLCCMFMLTFICNQNQKMAWITLILFGSCFLISVVLQATGTTDKTLGKSSLFSNMFGTKQQN